MNEKFIQAYKEHKKDKENFNAEYAWQKFQKSQNWSRSRVSVMSNISTRKARWPWQKEEKSTAVKKYNIELYPESKVGYHKFFQAYDKQAQILGIDKI